MLAARPQPVEGRAVADAATLAERLHSAAIHVLRRLRRSDPMTGISAAQLSALSVLMGGPRTLGELAAVEQVRPPTMSRLVRELEADGLVTRTRDETDARVVWVRWTPAGEELLTRGRQLRVATLQRQIEALPAADRQALDEALSIIQQLVDRL
jgi:DNA-binding MarR family transcriptional regulator